MALARRLAATAARLSQRRAMSSSALASYDKPDDDVVVRARLGYPPRLPRPWGPAENPFTLGRAQNSRPCLLPTHTPQEFPRKARGLDYDLNWSLAGDKITTRGEAYRNASLRDLLEFLPRSGEH